MKQRAQQTRLVKSYKTFLKSPTPGGNSLLYFSQFQMIIKLQASDLKYATLYFLTNNAKTHDF